MKCATLITTKAVTAAIATTGRPTKQNNKDENEKVFSSFANKQTQHVQHSSKSELSLRVEHRNVPCERET